MANDELTAPAEAAGDGAPIDARGRVLALVSRALVRLYKEQFGRGPETAHSYFAGPDTLICMLWDSLTPVERSMLQMDERQRLRDIRMMFQYATEDKFRAAVEEATGRKVRAFMSGIDVDEDISCEVFVLEPTPRP
jgi:uncharacterized protein YbcI